MSIDFGPYHAHTSFMHESETSVSLFRRVLFGCNTKWFNTSWLGIFLYVTTCCLNYLIGYYGIFRPFDWQVDVKEHDRVRVFGDIVTVGWFALGFVCLPWHQWERWTCIKTGDWGGFGRFMAWWLGTILTFFVYGYMGTLKLFQTSLASKNLSTGQTNVYIVAFATIATILIYWLVKLCPCKRCHRACNPTTARKVVFVRMFALIVLLFVVSAVLTSTDKAYVYHLHHWWFGFVLIMLSTAAMDNWVDYFLQGIFWTFLIETLFDYELTFGKFFI